jgi:hypothetical protein
MKKSPKANPDVITTAIASLVAKQKSKAALDPGVFGFKGEVTFLLDATVTKAAPEEYTPTSTVLSKAVLAICLARAGVQRDRIKSLILEAVEAAQGPYDDSVSDYIEVTAKAFEQVEGLVKELPKKTREGRCTVTGSALLIDFTPAKA